MRIDLLYPTLPPSLDGIGDYTAQLAAELARRHDVRVLTAAAAPDGIPGVEIQTVALPGVPAAAGAVPLAEVVDTRRPDWLLVQYNPFSWGRRGLNLHLPLALALLRADGGPRLAVMVHEPRVPVDSLHHAVMATWQGAQLHALGWTADLALFSIERWAEQYAGRFGRTRVVHAPVGSNIPLRADSEARGEIRRALGLDGAFVVGLFGSAHPSRLLGFARAALDAITRAGHAPHVLYVGPHGARVREALGDAAPLRDAGALPAADVSRCLSAMDLYLAPFRKGVSARRGSFMAALQHGLPTVSTSGVHTGDALRAQDGRAFLLAPDDDAARFGQIAAELARDAALRRRIARAGQALYDDRFDWPCVAAAVEAGMAGLCPTSTRVLLSSPG